MAESPQGTVAYRAVLLAGGLLVLGLLFEQLVTLLLAVLITVIVAIALDSFADRLQRWMSIPRAVGALIGIVLGLGVLAGIVALIIPPFIDQTNQFVDDLPEIAEELRGQVADLTGANPGEVSDRVQDFADRYADDPGQLVGPITSVGLGAAGFLLSLILVLITAYYMAINPEPLLSGVRSLIPPRHRDDADRVMGRLRTSWIGWVRGVVVDMLVSGILLYIGLTIIGLDLAIFFAVLTALLSVIPYFGSIASGLPPVLFALTDSPGKALLVLVVYTLVQQFEGNVIIPLVMARTVKLHPALIAIGVVVVGQLFGFVGLLVAVPVLSMLVILVEELWVKPMEEAERTRGTPEITRA